MFIDYEDCKTEEDRKQMRKWVNDYEVHQPPRPTRITTTITREFTDEERARVPAVQQVDVIMGRIMFDIIFERTERNENILKVGSGEYMIPEEDQEESLRVTLSTFLYDIIEDDVDIFNEVIDDIKRIDARFPTYPNDRTMHCISAYLESI